MKWSRVCNYMRAFLPSVYFNFRYLPFKQAIKLPILVYKPHFLRLGGSVEIRSENVYFGMINMGFFSNSIFPNSGITIKNDGMIIFKGRCLIGNDSHITCGRKGEIVFGDNFAGGVGMKMVSQCGISFGKRVRIGWGNIIIDTNFHPLYDLNNNKFKKAYGKIHIGDNNWLATQCMTMPGVTTPDYCIFGARTIITKGGKYESYCVHGGSPVKVLSRNVMRIIGQDSIDYNDEELMM